jgi:hypothetical protein
MGIGPKLTGEVVGESSTKLSEHATAEKDSRWWILRVKSRREKTVAKALSAMRIPYLVPSIRQDRIYAGSAVEVEIPLFPGFVFLHCDGDAIRRAECCEGAMRCIRSECQEQSQKEIANLSMAVRACVPMMPCRFTGKRIPAEVFGGPLKGVQGYLGIDSRELILPVQTLDLAVSLKVDPPTLQLATPVS